MATLNTSDMHATLVTFVAEVKCVKSHPLTRCAVKAQNYAGMLVEGKYSEKHVEGMRQLVREIALVNNSVFSGSKVRGQCHTLRALVIRMGTHADAVVKMRATQVA